MRVLNNYGRIQTCVVCKSEEIEKYNVYTPPFADAINSVYICGCKEHTEQAHKAFLDADSNRMDTLLRSSNS
jgi:hypothetical protein